MSDEQPEEGAASDAPDEGANEIPHEAIDEARAEPTAPAAAQAAPPPGEPPAASGGSSGWMIPKWLVVSLVAFVAVCVLAGGSFAIGRATASSGGRGRESVERPERRFPGFPGGNGNGNPARPANGVLLGVATEPASGGQQGAQVVNVLSGSPASQAGLQSGDVITAVDGNSVSSPSDLAQRIHSHQSGDQVTITYTRNGSSNDAQVQLANRSPDNTPNS